MSGSVYYLILDVLETDCHVLSRKSWKDCKPKPLHEAVFGQCKVIFHLHKPWRIARLHSYDCTMQPAARRFGCGGCLFSHPLNDTRFQEVADLSVKKFNQESNYNKYFVVGNITRGRVQVVAGTAYHVEFTIHESTCNKSKSPKNLAECERLDCEFAHTGYCKTFAVSHWSTPDEKKVERVSCDVFEPKAAVAEEELHKTSHKREESDNSDKKDHHEEKHGHKEGEGHHDEHAHDHLHAHEHHHGPVVGGQPPSSNQPIGSIVYLSLKDNPVDGAQGEEKTISHPAAVKSRSTDEGGPGPVVVLPEFFIPKPHFQPFPQNPAISDKCPGNIMENQTKDNLPEQTAPAS
ncbi:hypothetical protein GDO86_001816 [Hymenochirus boettgeri]|nr:hypothetical protein GDO86_001816 [Hymenochirus boettgeri]